MRVAGKYVALIIIGFLIPGCSFLFNKPPNAVINASPLISPTFPVEVRFDGLASSDLDGDIVRYEWDFGDGNRAEGPVVLHVFTRPGQYKVTLVVTDNLGLKGRAEVTVYVAVFDAPLEKSVKVEFPMPVDAAGFSVVSPGGRTSLGSDASSTVPLIPTEYQLIAVLNPKGKVILMRYIYQDALWPQDSLQEMSTASLLIDAQSTAAALILQNLIFAGIDAKTRRMLEKEVRNHPLFPHLASQVEQAIRENPDDPKFDFDLACEIAEDIYNKFLKPIPKEPDRFLWKYEIRRDGPTIAAGSSKDQYVWFLNPKAIYYAVEVRDHDTKETKTIFIIRPAEWVFLLFWSHGKASYLVECKRLDFAISKGTLDISNSSKVEKLATLANAFRLVSTILSLILPIDFPDLSNAIVEVEKKENVFKDIAKLVADILRGDVPQALESLLRLLRDENFAKILIAVIADITKSQVDEEQVAKLAKNVAHIAGSLLKALKATELVRFAYDLWTAPGGAGDLLLVSIQGAQGAAPQCSGARSITVIPQITKLSFKPSEPFANETVTFSCQAFDPDGQIVGYYWNFEGDNFLSGGTEVKHAFAKPGTHKVRVKVEDNAGGWEISEVTVSVKERKNLPPVARLQARPTEGPAPLSVTFDASASYDPDGRIVLFRWTFGDGESTETSAAIVQHTYTRAGNYVAAVTVIDDYGAQATAQVTITVRPPTCPDLTVTRLWVEPGQFTAGQRLTVRFTIKNIGDGNSGDFRAVLTLDGREVDSGFLRSLTPGQEVQAYSDVLVWPDDKCHTLAIVVDPEGTVPECNETNNQTAQSFCPSQQCVNRPSIWTDKNEYCIGEEAKIYIKVSSPSYVDVWVVYQNGETKTLVQNRYLEDPTKTYVITAKAGEPAGNRTLYIKARACGGEQIALWQYQVKNCQAPPAALPNLVIAEFRAWGDTSACPTGKIKFSLIVKNKGSAKSAKTTVFVYQEECRVISFGVWSAEVPELPPGEWIPFNGEVVYCNDVGGAAVTLVATVDPQNYVRESDESDNTRRLTIENPCAGSLLPDLTIANIEIILARQCADLSGQPIIVRFFVDIANTGAAASPSTQLLCTFAYCRDAPSRTIDVPPLNPGQRVRLVNQYEAIDLVGPPQCLDANRNAVLRCVVDPGNLVREKSEDNNVLQARVNIQYGYCL